MTTRWEWHVIDSVTLSGARSAAISVEPRLLADSLRRVLTERGLVLQSPDSPDADVDLVVVQDAATTLHGRVVVVLPTQRGDVGAVTVNGESVDQPIVDLRDLYVVIDQYLG